MENNISAKIANSDLLMGGFANKNTDYAEYQKYCKPKLAEMLNSLKLDFAFHKAKGNYLYYKDNEENEVPVLDFIGGFGAGFLGHNNDRLKTVLKTALDNDMPTNAQSSIRVEAYKLAEKLNNIHESNSNYYCHLTNSGAETVEAALKHSYKVHLDLVRREYERITRDLQELYHYVEDNHLEVELPEGVKDFTKYRDDLDEYNLAQYEEYQNKPVVCALKGSFHGKTSSALKTTFNKTFREGFEGMSAIQIVFNDLDKPERLREAVTKNQIEFLCPKIENNKLVLERASMTKVFAMIFEVVLGEGGVKPVSDDTLEKLAEIHEDIKVPFIIDEIQTGCGRTGSIFSYSDTPLSKIDPEYILLSKALGGGLVKIGACMIKEKIYDLDFGILHTSTFAEDDISCKVASVALDMMTENEGDLLTQATKKGTYLRALLNRLKQKYPNIVKDVRGRGLMIGLEFQDMSSYGPLFRYAGKQGFISLLISSYLLNQHNVRVLAPLTTLFKGNPGKKRQSILRIQPSVYITEQEIETLSNALEECFNVIESNNEYCLMAHLFDDNLENLDRTSPKKIPLIYPEHDTHSDFDARIGFVVHITELKHLLDYYLPSFKEYDFSKKKLVKWWNKLSRFLEPDIMHRTYIDSDGFVVELNLVCVPYFPKYMIKTFINGQIPSNKQAYNQKLLQEMQDKIMDATIVARDLGDECIPTILVGLGAYTSIVTDNGRSINDYEIPITTGNAYTTALMGQGIIKAAADNEVDLSSSKVAVIGAAGNIGSALTALLSFYAGKLFLVGSDKASSNRRVQGVINESFKTILQEVKNQLDSSVKVNDIALNGIAGDVYNNYIKPYLLDQTASKNELATKIIEGLQAKDLPSQSGEWLNQFILDENNNENPYYSISSSEVISDCDVISIATNSSDAWLISPDNVKKGAIICCASVPSNLSKTFKDHLDDFTVFDGGYASLPEGNIIDFVGMPKDGMAYGCLSESLLLAFDGQNSSFAKGKLTIEQVLKTIELADLYGFDLGELRLGDAVHQGYN